MCSSSCPVRDKSFVETKESFTPDRFQDTIESSRIKTRSSSGVLRLIHESSSNHVDRRNHRNSDESSNKWREHVERHALFQELRVKDYVFHMVIWGDLRRCDDCCPLNGRCYTGPKSKNSFLARNFLKCAQRVLVSPVLLGWQYHHAHFDQVCRAGDGATNSSWYRSWADFYPKGCTGRVGGP